MKSVLVCFACLLVVAEAAHAQKNVPRQARSDPPQLIVGQGQSFGNLTLFPVSSPTLRGDDRFTTLDEGLKAGTVEIREVGAARAGVSRPRGNAPRPQRQQAGANNRPSRGQEVDSTDPFGEDAGNDVNRLLVVNKSTKPLYLMPGEILLGGDQDRTIGEELVIAPDGKPHEIEVFCVEHGRWGSRDAAELRGYIAVAGANSGRDAAIAEDADVVKEANSGKFIGSVGSLNKAGRLAVQHGKNQSKVWEEVAKENGKGSVKSKSGAFTGNYAEEDAVKRLDPYLARLQKPIAETRNVVGVIVAVNGRPESIDVFESTPLFKKLWPKLLKSYALDAKNAEVSKQPKRCSREDALAFLNDVAASKTKETSAGTDVETAHAESDKALVFSARQGRYGAAAASSRRDMGGFGGAIHSAGYAK